MILPKILTSALGILIFSTASQATAMTAEERRRSKQLQQQAPEIDQNLNEIIKAMAPLKALDTNISMNQKVQRVRESLPEFGQDIFETFAQSLQGELDKENVHGSPVKLTNREEMPLVLERKMTAYGKKILAKEKDAREKAEADLEENKQKSTLLETALAQKASDFEAANQKITQLKEQLRKEFRARYGDLFEELTRLSHEFTALPDKFKPLDARYALFWILAEQELSARFHNNAATLKKISEAESDQLEKAALSWEWQIFKWTFKIENASYVEKERVAGHLARLDALTRQATALDTLLHALALTPAPSWRDYN